MSAGITLVIAIPATGILMMRFRKRWLAKINIAVPNLITGLFAGWLPGFGILKSEFTRRRTIPPSCRVEESPMRCRFALAVSAVSSFVPV